MDNPIPYDAYQITQTVMVANFNAHKDGEQHSPWQKNLYEKGYTISINSSKIDSGGLSLGGKIKNPLPTPLKRKRMIADKISPKDYIDARQNAYEKNVDSRLDRFEKKIDEYRKETKEEMKAFINEMKADNKSTRTTTIVTAITTVISIVGGIAAFNSSLISNMQQSYGMGKEGAVIQQKVVALEHRMDGLEQRMNSVESKLDKIIEQTAK